MSGNRLRSTCSTITAILCTFCLASCGGGGEAENVAGPCMVVTDGPSLTIASVTNAATGAAIPVVTLSEVNVGGWSGPTLVSGNWVNIKAVGANLECTVACGFSNSIGATTFKVTAAGYATKAISAMSGYATSVPGACGPGWKDGARLSIQLDPLQ